MLSEFKIKSPNNKLLSLLIGLLFLSTNLFSTPYYVSGTYTAGTSIYVTASGVNSAGKGKATSTPAATLTWLLNTSGYAFTSGDTIYVDAGTYKTDINLKVTIAGLGIKGAGTGLTIFDNNNAGTCTNFFMEIEASNVTIRDFTVQNYQNNGTQGDGPISGQAIIVGDGSTTYSGIRIFNIETLYNGGCSGNAAIVVLAKTTSTIEAGGGLCNVPGSTNSGGLYAWGLSIDLTIKNYVLSGNSALAYQGAGLLVAGNNTTVVRLLNSTVSYNTVDAADGSVGGGGIISEGYLEIEDCVIQNNAATGTNGGGIYLRGGTAYIRRTKIQNNTSTKGGGIYMDDAGDWGPGFSPTRTTTLVVDSTLFSGNTSSSTSNGNDINAHQISHAITVTCNDVTFSSTADQIETSGSASVSYTKCGTTAKQNGSVIAGGASPDYTPSPSPPTPSSTVCSVSIIVLPIELIKFEGSCINNQITLIWQTATETNNKVFNIEKSLDGIHFYVIGNLNGAGNSIHSLNYSFIDKTTEGGNAYYRLNQTDYNGNSSRSKVIYVERSCNKNIVSDVFVYPNPSASQVNLNLTLFQSSEISVEIYNDIGQLIQLIPTQLYETGIQTISIDDNQLSKGIYFIKVSVNRQESMHKIIKL